MQKRNYATALADSLTLNQRSQVLPISNRPITKFKNAGLEIQITEFDAGAKSESEQAAYVYDVMKAVCEVKKEGGNITGFTWWGMSDDISWRKDKSPLLFSNIWTPKASYYRTLDAFTDTFTR